MSELSKARYSAEEDYITTPLSVMYYIGKLEVENERLKKEIEEMKDKERNPL